jgi:ribosome biogenesis protein Nip4
MGVVIYYLDKDLVNRSYLIGIRRINGAYTGENITKAVMPVLIKNGILLKLGYFIANNDARNDIYIRVILRKHRPNIKDFNGRRVYCLRYIINLAAKAFLFGKNADAFKDIINSVYKNGYLEALREKWRK